MSKHKKTRKEKIIADYRHQVYIFKNENINPDKHTLAIAINDTSYFSDQILKDILKTGILTLSIIAAQIVLYLLLKGHVITIPMIKY